MSDKDKKIEQENEVAPEVILAEVAVKVASEPVMDKPAGFLAKNDFRKKNFRRTPRAPRVKPEFDQKIINVRRVARVSAGGRRFNFSVAMIIGNRRGSVGVGTGKGADTAIAIEKSLRDARKNMIDIKLMENFSIPNEVRAKYSSARIMIKPAPGRGIAAGSAVRSVIELAGIRDVTAKIFSPSKNQLNVARATILALSKVKGKPAIKAVEIGDQV